MALSQVQCLDEHHVNWRVTESKPEFFYSEDQRLALEALLTGGREAFSTYLGDHGLRNFLSEPELLRLARTVEAYRPGSEHLKAEAGASSASPKEYDGGNGPLSLQYWPDRSEDSIPDLDLGWPDAASYRGVTRVNVHTQPPADGHTHIKEVVRKAIAQAQKVIAVVMDQFSDVDIFKDLLDAAYKRRVPVYIVIDTSAISCFLDMCSRANMHQGHLKNLRVRCSEGVEFYTRSAQKVRGSLSQRYMLIDGDRAVTGSYSFTWSASRLDRNLITVLSGQAVETFDKQFRDLYMTSRGVSLAKVPLEEEPIPDFTPIATPAPVSAAVARKLINPKYALVTSQAKANNASPASSANDSSNKNSTTQNPLGRVLKPAREPVEAPPLHPGLANLEKVYLIPYLPTWPEPDPPRDVIGFINVRDASRPQQVHLQRSQQFETSQAIRFTSPFSMPEKPLPETATLRNTQHDKHTPDTQNPDTPDTQSPDTQNPDTQIPDTQIPDTQNPDTQNPDTQNPDTQIPDTQIPDTQIPDTPDTQSPDTQSPDTQNPDTQIPDTPDTQNPDTQIPDTPDTQNPDTNPSAPPVPKPRTLQLLISPAHSHQSGRPQVSLVPRTESQSGTPPASISQSETLMDTKSRHGPRDEEEEEEEGLEEEWLDEEEEGLEEGLEGWRGSSTHDDNGSTTALCDQTANDTSCDDLYYECNESDPTESSPVANGVTAELGRVDEGHRHGNGVHVMARFSQSMLDLRPHSQSDNRGVLMSQSQDRRSQQTRPQPHRHIGQLFQSSRSPGRDGRQRCRTKVVIAKPGSVHRSPLASCPVIGGHRYLQGQSLQPSDTRSSRSPRRHSPAYKGAGLSPGHASPRRASIPAGAMGVSFSKLTNQLLRGRYIASQTKASLDNKEVG
ncbi:protein FAM83G-like [Salvelinus fontinalis]|uniref:protein FAM83G-like n=1 Tax=Salvelinus fontinalis TaxID=8038 RepID=UPI0024857E13|nr:protein FAM83G-like [Salvelinus fontinalis]